VLLLAAIFAVVYAFSVMLVDKVQLLTVLNGIFLGVVTAVIIVYSPLFFLSLKKRSADRVSQLAIGIGLLWLAIAGQKIYWIVWKANDMPIEWQSNYFLSALTFLAIIGGGLFVTAPGYPSPQGVERVGIWGEHRNMLLTLGAIGGVLTFCISVYTGTAF
jgi:heme/copper-type cytochrome/quinol oxidase subunit 4